MNSVVNNLKETIRQAAHWFFTSRFSVFECVFFSTVGMFSAVFHLSIIFIVIANIIGIAVNELLERMLRK